MRQEIGCGAVFSGVGSSCCRRLSHCAGASILTMAAFPRPRSPNPACGFPAPGSPVGSCPSHTGHRVGLGAGPVIPADHARCTTAIVPPASFPVCRRACSRPGGVEPLGFNPFACACDTFRTLCLRGGVIGYGHSRRPSSFACPSTPEAPCLDRHYPASSVLRASPPPCRPGLPLAGNRLACARHRTGLPVLPRFPSSMHAGANTPAGTVRCICRLLPASPSAFPIWSLGRLPHYAFRGLLDVHACSGLHGR